MVPPCKLEVELAIHVPLTEKQPAVILMPFAIVVEPVLEIVNRVEIVDPDVEPMANKLVLPEELFARIES